MVQHLFYGIQIKIEQDIKEYLSVIFNHIINLE